MYPRPRAATRYRIYPKAWPQPLFLLLPDSHAHSQALISGNIPLPGMPNLDATFNISDGSGEAVDVTAGVEINTDWKPGNDYDQEM